MVKWIRRFMIWLGHTPSYVNYIHSAEWAALSRRMRELNPRCSLCNRPLLAQSRKKTVVLHVHHRTYLRLARELDEDLTVVCADCHKLFHDNYVYDPRGFFVPKRRERHEDKEMFDV